MDIFEKTWRAILEKHRTNDGYWCEYCDKPITPFRSICCDCAQELASRDPQVLFASILRQTTGSKKLRRKLGPVIPVEVRKRIEIKRRLNDRKRAIA